MLKIKRPGTSKMCKIWGKKKTGAFPEKIWYDNREYVWDS